MLTLCSHYAQLCNGILPSTQGLGQATCCRLWLHAAVNPKIAPVYHAVFGQL